MNSLWGRIKAMLSPAQNAPPAVESIAPRLTPQDVEARIDAAGREEVFAEARRLGWNGPAPLWVWGAIASEVLARKASAAPRPTVH